MRNNTAKYKHSETYKKEYTAEVGNYPKVINVLPAKKLATEVKSNSPLHSLIYIPIIFSKLCNLCTYTNRLLSCYK